MLKGYLNLMEALLPKIMTFVPKEIWVAMDAKVGEALEIVERYDVRLKRIEDNQAQILALLTPTSIPALAFTPLSLEELNHVIGPAAIEAPSHAQNGHGSDKSQDQDCEPHGSGHGA